MIRTCCKSPWPVPHAKTCERGSGYSELADFRESLHRALDQGFITYDEFKIGYRKFWHEFMGITDSAPGEPLRMRRAPLEWTDEPWFEGDRHTSHLQAKSWLEV